MFTVPGWSVSTSDLKPQKDVPSLKQPETSTVSSATTAEGKENGSSAGHSAKKRKRGDGVTKSNLDEMFKRHIEGHVESKAKPNSKKNKRNRDQNKNKGTDNKPVQNHTQEKKRQENDSVNVSEGKVNKKPKKSHRQETTQTNGDAPEVIANAAVTSNTPLVDNVSLPPAMPPAASKLTPLQQKMRDKLISARFRHLNETLYTTPSQQALAMFDANPELFSEYHSGFSRQVQESWPLNPVDEYIAAVRKRGAISSDKKHSHHSKSQTTAGSLPRRPNGACTIADLGCGDAQFARALTPSAKKLQLKLLSYDLHAPNSLITKADIANLPVADGSVDVTIFCLSLMGTNWVSFVEEAWRVLRGDGKGECWVSEVKSRFGKVSRKKAQIGLKKEEATMSNTQKKKNKNKKKKKNGGESDGDEDENDEDDIFAEDAHNNHASSSNDETDISSFVEVFRSRGFMLKQESVDKSNKMFVKMEFVKAGGAPTKGKYAGVTPARTERQAPAQSKKRFIDRNDEGSKGMTAEEEAKVLKPCVYKSR